MKIIVKIEKYNPWVEDRIRIQNHLLSFSLIINGQISLVKAKNTLLLPSPFNSIHLPQNSANHFFSGNRMVGFEGSRPGISNQQSEESSRYPVQYIVNAILTGSRCLTKEQFIKLITPRFHDDVQIIKYEFDSTDNFAPSKPEESQFTSINFYNRHQTNNSSSSEDDPFFQSDIEAFSSKLNQEHILNSIFAKYKYESEMFLPNPKVALRRAAAAGNIEDLEALLSIRGLDINAQDDTPNKQYTALHWAAMRNHLNAYKLLIKVGANPEIKNASGKMPSEYLKTKEAEIEHNGFDYSKIFS